MDIQNNHTCPICRRVFTRSDNLRVHIGNTHLNVRQHCCLQCDRLFKRKEHLQKHQKRKHSAFSPSSSTTPLLASATAVPSSTSTLPLSSSSTTTAQSSTLSLPSPVSATPTTEAEPSSSTSSSLSTPSTSKRKRKHSSNAQSHLPPPQQRRLDSWSDAERSFSYLPSDLRDIYIKHRESIKTHTRQGRNVSTLTIFWDPSATAPQWEEDLLDMFHAQTVRFKINYSHSFILRHKETKKLSFYHASTNNNTVLERPLLISSKPDFLAFLQSLNDDDILENVQKQRPDSRFSVVAIPSTSFYIYHLSDYPIGCGTDLPNFLVRQKYLRTLHRDDHNAFPYRDGLCFFRCLALHRGASVSALQSPAQELYRRWLTHSSSASKSSGDFPGVTLMELDRLEKLFELNIDVFEYMALETQSPVLVPCRRSAYSFTTTLRLLHYSQHFMYIIDIDKLGHALACPHCQKLWKTNKALGRHEKTCSGVGSVVTYEGGVYQSPRSIVEELHSYGLFDAPDYVYPYRATYDFEVYFENSNLPTQSTHTRYTARHVPLSVSVASNVPGFSEAVCFVSEGDPADLVGRMVDYLHKIARRAATCLFTGDFYTTFSKLDYVQALQRSSTIEEEEVEEGEEDYSVVPVHKLRYRLRKYIQQLPVVGFNSSRYDINVIKPYLLKRLMIDVTSEKTGEGEEEEEEEEVGIVEVTEKEEEKKKKKKKTDRREEGFIVKRNNQYLCLSTKRLRFLDIINFLAPGFSYSKYLKAFGVTEMKSFFPYEYITSLERLDETRLPSHDKFYSTLKNSNISDDEYRYCQDIWTQNNMTTLKDFLIYYNNKDVGPFLTALERQIDIYTKLGVDLLKDGLSVPGITLKYLFKTLANQTYFSLFNNDEKDIHTLLRDNITGGPSIIFHRYHEKDKTFIRNDPSKIVKSIQGYDANALYLSALMCEMPTEHPIFRRADNQFKPERRDRYGRRSREWLEYIMHTENIYIQHKFNGRERQFGQRHIRVDGFDARHGTVYQFHGCLWHGHDCDATKGIVTNPMNGKSMTELRDNTREITSYLRDSIGLTVVEMWECQWKAKIARDPSITHFINRHLPHVNRRYTLTETEVIRLIETGDMFGLVQCDLEVPAHLRDYFAELQPIFKNTLISRRDIGQHMQQYAENHKLLLQPRRTLVGSFFGEQILVATPLLRWYLSHGLVVRNITLIVEYQPKACFRQFGEEVSNARRGGDIDPSKAILADTYKLLGNSAYGKTMTNLGKHRNVSVTDSDTAQKLVNEGRFRKLTELDTNVVEVELLKQTVNWNLPLQIGYFVYQYAKLRMLEFHYDFLDKYIDRTDYQLLEMDTDSLYLALSASSLEGLVRPDLKSSFYDEWHKWFPAQACDTHAQQFKQARIAGLDWTTTHCTDCQARQRYDKRTPGLFKTEYSGDGFIGLCSKTYFCFGEEGGVKLSTKGLNKNQNTLTKDTFMDVLNTRESGGGTNHGFRVQGAAMYSYLQQRKSLSYFYVKRRVGEDGISTHPTLV